MRQTALIKDARLSTNSLHVTAALSRDTILSLTQELLTGLGWDDKNPAIYAADHAERANYIQLREALTHYEMIPSATQLTKLLEALDIVIVAVGQEHEYAKVKQLYYQQEVKKEAETKFSSYLGRWAEWVFHGVQSFFGSNNEQLAERYADIAQTRRTMLQQLNQYREVLAAENLSIEVDLEETSVIEVVKELPRPMQLEAMDLSKSTHDSNQHQLLTTTALTEAFTVVTYPIYGGGQASGMLSNGNFIVVWDAPANGNIGEDIDIYAQIFNFNGTSITSQWVVNDNPTNYGNIEVNLVVQPDNNIIIAWSCTETGGQGISDICIRQFNGEGIALSSEIYGQLSCSNNLYYPHPFISMQPSGDITLSCAGEALDFTCSNAPYIYFQSFTSNLTRVGDVQKIFCNSLEMPISGWFFRMQGSGDSYRIAAQPGGNLIITYNLANENDQTGATYAYGHRFASDGTSLAPPFRMDTQTTGYSFFSNSFSTIDVQSNGDFIFTGVISINADGQEDIYMSCFNANGTPKNLQLAISEPDSNKERQPMGVRVLPSNDFIVMWAEYVWPYVNDNVDYYARHFQSDCSSSEAKFFVGNAFYGLGGNELSLNTQSDRNFMITWMYGSPSTDWSILGRIFETDPCVPPTPIVSHYEYALMMVHVYRKLEDDDAVLPPDWSVTRTTFSDGWELLRDSSATNGYFGSAYINPSRKALVIAQRGTDFPGLSASISDLGSDLHLFFGDIPPQFNNAQQFYYQVQTYLNQNSALYDGDICNYGVSFTGHSLGATLAELSATVHQKSAVTFESPGIVEILNNNPQTFPVRATNITTYNAAPDEPNTSNGHLGHLYRIYSPFDSFLYLPELISYTYYSFVDQHAKNKILQQFNPETGQIKISAPMNQWPSAIGFDAFRDYDQNYYYWQNFLNLYHIWGPARTAFISQSLLRSNLPGVTILGDDSGNVFWGSTNSPDILRGGAGDDTYWLFSGNDIVTDTAGNETYHLYVDNQALTLIADEDHTGILRINDEYALTGNASWTGLPNTYILELIQRILPFSPWPTRNVKYIMTMGYSSLNTSSDNPQTLTIVFADNKENSLILSNFINGQFGIYLESATPLKNYQITRITGGITHIAAAETSVVGLGGDDTLIVDTPGGNFLYTGGGHDNIIYQKPTIGSRRLLSSNSTSESEIIEDFDLDDQLTLQGYQEGEYQLQINNSDTRVITNDLPVIVLLNVPNVAATYNASFNFIQIVRDAEPPIFLENSLIVQQNATIIMTTHFLNAYDSDSVDLNFTISGLIHGNFTQVNSSQESITQFSLLDILAQTILFAHDGSDFAPAYNVTLSDGLFVTDSIPANITFNRWSDITGSSSTTGVESSSHGDSSVTSSTMSSSSEIDTASDSSSTSAGSSSTTEFSSSDETTDSSSTPSLLSSFSEESSSSSDEISSMQGSSSSPATEMSSVTEESSTGTDQSSNVNSSATISSIDSLSSSGITGSEISSSTAGIQPSPISTHPTAISRSTIIIIAAVGGASGLIGAVLFYLCYRSKMNSKKIQKRISYQEIPLQQLSILTDKDSGADSRHQIEDLPRPPTPITS